MKLLKGALKRTLVFFLTFIMIVGNVTWMPVSASAEPASLSGLSDSRIQAIYEGGNWGASINEINGSVQGSSSGCGGSKSESSTLTLKNNSDYTATLSFGYSVVLNGGSAAINGTAVTESSTYSIELEAGGSVEIALTSDAAAKETSINLFDIRLLRQAVVKVAFAQASNGSYSVDNVAINEVTEYENSSTKGYSLSAVPDEGYQFVSWRSSDGVCLSTSKDTVLYFDQNVSVYPEFAPERNALFSVGNDQFADLNKALEKASDATEGANVVVVAKDGIVSSGDYIVGSGVTLLVPYDSAGTVLKDKPENTGSNCSTPYKFRSLNLESGAHLTVSNGAAICVGARHSGNMSFGCGAVTGPYGQIVLDEGSRIDIESGGKLYAYGYIAGKGLVQAFSGSEVWEYFQIRDWRGGTASSSMQSNKERVFPFSQYYLQNIESELKLHSGATEKAYLSIYSSVTTVGVEVVFYGDGGLFCPKNENSTLTKRYDEATDRLKLTLDGDMQLSEINVKGFGSKDYVLPINGNVDIEVSSGTLESAFDIALLPGSKVLVREGATLKESANLFVVDRDDWVGKGYVSAGKSFVPIGHTSSDRYARTEADLLDATIDVSGTLAIDGNLFTTSHGANVISTTGRGCVSINKTPDGTVAFYQAAQSGTKVTYHKIDVAPAVLQNGDGSVTETKDAPDSTTLYFMKSNDSGSPVWRKSYIEISDVDFKTEYKVGERLDVSGLTFDYVARGGEDSKQSISATSEMISGFDSSAVSDSQTLTITYEGATATFDIKIVKAEGPTAPSGLQALKPSVKGNADGKIVGTTTAMEYSSTEDFAAAYDCADGETGGLVAGTYYVRTKETATHHAGEAVTLVIPEGDPAKYHVDLQEVGNGSTGTGDYIAGVKVTISAGAKAKSDFVKWTTTSEDVTFESAQSVDTSFIMPEHAVTVKAHWHTHDLAFHSGIEATCESEGVKAYYECKECKKIFEDEDCLNQIQNLDEWKKIPALNHSWSETPSYKWSADNSKCTAEFTCKNDASHTQDIELTVSSSIVKEATCTEPGERHFEASGQFGESDILTGRDVAIPANGHSWGEWQHDEDSHWKVCAVCNAEGERGAHSGGSATLTQRATCETCGCEYGSLATPPSGGGGGGSASQDKVETSTDDRGNSVTTVTSPSGETTVTTESRDGTETIVEKDKAGNVESVKAALSKEAAENGETVLPIDPEIVKAGNRIDVEIPASVDENKSIKVIVPVTSDDQDDVPYGMVLMLVDEDGTEIPMPKTSIQDEGLAVFVGRATAIRVVDRSVDFPDVSGTEWYVGVSQFASSRNILTGVETASGKFEFQGDAPTTRAMFVTMLSRMELEPCAAGEAGLSDVSDNDWFANAAAWGVENGLLAGYDDGRFGAYDHVTREQIAVFLLRYADFLGIGFDGSAVAADLTGVSDYARGAMEWAVANGLILGDDATGALRPTDGATRAEAAAIVMRFIDKMHA